MKAQQGFRYVDASGAFTLDGLRLINSMDTRMLDMERKFTAIAAIVAPVGGATVDAEARAAVAAIIAGAV